ncbi:hypothetical protein [Paenibacillus jiagnxiensis]|uniref:hypothetical protein n=1 Tax=Paenibacillus jiagnxiensis TaxID=3228926 RepID=UPI0033B71A61
MEQTVKLYKWENFDALPGRRYGFAIDGELLSFSFIGEISEPEEYVLPAGYTYEADSQLFGQAIWDDNGTFCHIDHSQGKPVLVSTKRVVLEKKSI